MINGLCEKWGKSPSQVLEEPADSLKYVSIAGYGLKDAE